MSDALRTRSLMAGFLASSAIHVVVALWISGAVVVRVVPVGSHGSTSVAAMSERPAAASRLTPRPHAEEPGAGADDGRIVQTVASFTNRARSYAAQLANHLWQSTLFAIAVALVTMTFRNNRAGVRYGLWLSASAKFFIPFSILTALGSTVSWTAPADAASTFSAMVQISQTFLETASSGLSPAIPTPGSANWVLVAALGVWACGLIGIAFARLRMWRRIRAMVQTSVAIDLPNMPAGVYARVASGLLEPAVIGICRPILLLPAGIERHLTAPQLDAVLTHELCHMQRRDNLTAAMHMVVETMFWFHPLVWWIGARLVDERERACDEEVLRTCAEPRAYADGILNICRRYVEARLACVSGVTGSDLKKRIEAIMRNQPGDVVASWKKIALIGLTVSVLAVPFGVGVMTASPDSSQSPAADSSPLAFEVVSVRPNRSGNGGGPFGPQPGGRFAATNVTLGFLVRFAYESSPWNRALDPFQVSGGPSWVTSDRFDVNAKAATDVTLPQMRRMVQAMLADRFKLRSHVEKRELPVYRLVLARSDRAPAAQLRRTALDCTRPQNPFSGFNPDEGVPCGYFGMSPTINPASGQSNQAFRGMTMEGLASNLRPFLGRTVIDGTGLLGHYDGDFEFTAEIVLPPPPPGLPNPYEGRVFPSIFSVLPQQLGLRLESARGPVDVLVIDSAEPPTEN